MQICADHWADLREAIHRRGLEHLVARSGEDAADATVRELEAAKTGETPPVSDFDPLMRANVAIFSAYMRDVGLSAMAGQKCPLCEVEKTRAGLAANWIEGSSEDSLQQARSLGLVGGVQ